MNFTIKWIMINFIILLSMSELKSQKLPEEIISDFITEFQNSPSKGVDYIFKDNKWMDLNSNEVRKLKIELESIHDIVGKYYGYEKISEKSIGKSIKVYTYFIKYERQPFRFKFTFYKPNDKWLIQNFNYDDQIEDTLGEMRVSH